MTRGLVTISIDDGWRSTYRNAIPILDAAGLRSTNYIITGRFDHPDYVSRTEVLSLQSKGHEVGSHTRSHLDLTSMSEPELESEIAGSRDDLYAIGIHSVSSFAYPFGIYNGAVVEKVRRANFLSARSVIPGYNFPGASRYLLKRQNLGGSITIAELTRMVDTAISEQGWLIFMAHRIDSTVSEFSITPALFQELVNYLLATKVRVVTVTEGVSMTP